MELRTTNLLKAINSLSQRNSDKINEYYKNNIRIQQVGDSLEYYIKDIFCNALEEKDINKKNKLYSDYFSYLGKANNPPDLMIKGGDAIEIKKIESNNSFISLNSSFPKNKLYANDPLITKYCKECEVWQEKDIIYAIGSVKSYNLNSLWLIYGDCFVADKEIYEKIKNTITEGVSSIENVEFSFTKELGRVNKVDPLGITYLRIRGMWGIQHPFKIFNYISDNIYDNKVNILLLEEKYHSFPLEDIKAIEQNSKIRIKDIKIKNPNNPANLLNAKYLTIE